MMYGSSPFQRAPFVFASVAVLAGCASSGIKTEIAPPKVDAKIQAAESKYGKTVQAVPLREMSSRSQCRDTGTNKNQTSTWQEAVARASGCVAKGKWAYVEKWGEWLAKHDPRAPWGPYYLSLAAEGQSHMPRALWMAELALKKAPTNGLVTFQKAKLLLNSGARAEALKLFERATTLDPQLTDAHILLAQHSFDELNWSGAERFYKMALSSDRRNLNALLGLAQVHMQTKSYSQAQEVLATAALEHPRNLEVQMMFGKSLETDEAHLGEAIQAYKKSRGLAQEARAERTLIDDIDAKIKKLEARLPATSGKVSLRETEGK